MSKVNLLTKSQLEEYGIKALKMYWDSLANKPTPNFENFVDNVFYDEIMQKNYRSEDLSSYGKIVAMYLLDHPYPSMEKLKNGFTALANKTKVGMIPTRWSLTEVVTKASSINSLNDYLKALNVGINQSTKEFKGVALKAAGIGGLLYLGYALGGVLLLLIAQRNTNLRPRLNSRPYAAKPEVQNKAITGSIDALANQAKELSLKVADIYRTQGIGGVYRAYPMPFYIAGGVVGLLTLRFVLGGRKTVYVAKPA